MKKRVKRNISFSPLFQILAYTAQAQNFRMKYCKAVRSEIFLVSLFFFFFFFSTPKIGNWPSEEKNTFSNKKKKWRKRNTLLTLMKSKRPLVILNICKQRSPKCIYDEMCLLVLNWAQLQLFHFFKCTSTSVRYDSCHVKWGWIKNKKNPTHIDIKILQKF